MERKRKSTGLSLKEFVRIANRYQYSVEMSTYSGCLCGFYPFLKSPYGSNIETKKHFSYDALKRAFERCDP